MQKQKDTTHWTGSVRLVKESTGKENLTNGIVAVDLVGVTLSIRGIGDVTKLQPPFEEGKNRKC